MKSTYYLPYTGRLRLRCLGHVQRGGEYKIHKRVWTERPGWARPIENQECDGDIKFWETSADLVPKWE